MLIYPSNLTSLPRVWRGSEDGCLKDQAGNFISTTSYLRDLRQVHCLSKPQAPHPQSGYSISSCSLSFREDKPGECL